MPDLRLIRAEVLKLRRRDGMVALCAVLSVAAVAIFYVIQAIRGGAGGAGHLGDAIAVLALSGSVAGVIVGATAGAADIETASSGTSWPPVARATRCSLPACRAHGRSSCRC
jgi:hypothetical protein